MTLINKIKNRSGLAIKNGTLLILLVILGSCTIFETDEEYSISAFDTSVSDGLMNNTYTALLDTVLLAIPTLPDQTTMLPDETMDSLMAIATYRDAINTIVDSLNAIIRPSLTKQRLISSAAFSSGYAILDLSQETATENLVFFLSNHVTLTIWNDDGEVIELTDDVFPTGMIVVSDLTMARYEYDLEPITYLIRFTKAKTLLNNAVSQFEVVVLNEDAEASTTAEKVCGIFNSSSSNTLNLDSFVDLDTNWVDYTIDSLYNTTTRRQEFVTALEANNATISSDNLEDLIIVFKENILTETYFIFDLSSYAGFNAGFYLNDYFEVKILAAVDSAEVMHNYQGITYAEVGACSTLRQKIQFNLSNQKYIVGLIKYADAPDNSKFKLVIIDED